VKGPRLRTGPVARWRGVTTPDANGVLEVSFNLEAGVLRVLLDIEGAERLHGALGLMLRHQSDRNWLHSQSSMSSGTPNASGSAPEAEDQQ
jgi:hypothetical protein